MDNSNKKILVVEDDSFLRKIIVKKLLNEGYTVIEAIDGEKGLKMAKEKRPDLILLDLVLPGIDGFEVLKRMKNGAEIANIPVVILSNLGNRVDIERGLELGAVDFLVKAHLAPRDIIERIENIFKKMENV